MITKIGRYFAIWLPWSRAFSRCLMLIFGVECLIYALLNSAAIASDNFLLPSLRRAIIWTNSGIFSTEQLGKNFTEIRIECNDFDLRKYISKWQPSLMWSYCVIVFTVDIPTVSQLGYCVSRNVLFRGLQSERLVNFIYAMKFILKWFSERRKWYKKNNNTIYILLYLSV